MRKECLASCRECERGSVLSVEALGRRAWWVESPGGRMELRPALLCKYDKCVARGRTPGPTRPSTR